MGHTKLFSTGFVISTILRFSIGAGTERIGIGGGGFTKGSSLAFLCNRGLEPRGTSGLMLAQLGGFADNKGSFSSCTVGERLRPLSLRSPELLFKLVGTQSLNSFSLLLLLPFENGDSLLCVVVTSQCVAGGNDGDLFPLDDVIRWVPRCEPFKSKNGNVDKTSLLRGWPNKVSAAAILRSHSTASLDDVDCKRKDTR